MPPSDMLDPETYPGS